MNPEKEALLRVQGGLFHLRKGLAPFVEAQMKARFGANWLQYARRAQGYPTSGELDAYGLLKTMIDHWRDVFAESFSRDDQYRMRNFTSTALEARNTTSHLSAPLPDEAALRYLDAMHELLKAVKAGSMETGELKRLYAEQRRFGDADPAAQPIAVRRSNPDSTAATIGAREGIAAVNRRCRAATLTRDNTRFANVNSAVPIWWLDVPLHKCERAGLESEIHLVLNNALNHRLYHLRVPTEYLRTNLPRFRHWRDKDKISLYLSTDVRNLFRDRTSGCRFDQFLCRCSEEEPVARPAT